MSELSWGNVGDGDGVKVKHRQGGVVEGIFDSQSLQNYVKISGLFFVKDSLELLEHTPTYRTGDIGLIHSELTGSNYVGIYRDGVFYSSDGLLPSNIHTIAQGGDYTIKILGNVNEQ